MTPSAEPLTAAWIVEALHALGGSGTSLDVLKQIWSRHRTDIEAGDALVYTWQLDAHSAADHLSRSGRLMIAVDRWSLTAGAPAMPRPGTWTEVDIQTAVNAYISLLQADHEGRPVHRREAMTLVVQQTQRTTTAVEAMFANISAVVQENGYEYLAAYPPKSNVPAGVRPAVKVALNL